MVALKGKIIGVAAALVGGYFWWDISRRAREEACVNAFGVYSGVKDFRAIFKAKGLTAACLDMAVLYFREYQYGAYGQEVGAKRLSIDDAVNFAINDGNYLAGLVGSGDPRFNELASLDPATVRGKISALTPTTVADANKTDADFDAESKGVHGAETWT